MPTLETQAIKICSWKLSAEAGFRENQTLSETFIGTRFKAGYHLSYQNCANCDGKNITCPCYHASPI